MSTAGRLEVAVAGLEPGHKEALEQVPGVSIRRDLSGIWCPRGLRPLMEQWLSGWGLAAQWPERDAPRHTAASVAAEIVAAPGLASWLASGEGGPFGLARFQFSAIAAMRNGSAFLEEPAGAGKTVQGVVWAALEHPLGTTVIVTKSAVVRQFSREVTRFTSAEVLALDSPSKLPVRNKVRVTPEQWVSAYLERASEAGQKPWIVTSWAALRKVSAVLRSIPLASVVFDESQLGKNPKRRQYLSGPPDWQWEWRDSQSAHAARLANHVASCGGRAVAMTATPVFDLRGDLWGQLALVDPAGWGETGTKFFHRYCAARPGEFGGLDITGTSNTEELQTRLKGLMHRVPKAVTHAELPQARITFCPVPPRLQDKPAPGFARDMKRLAKLSKAGDASARGQLVELQLAEAGTRKRSEVLRQVKDALALGADDAEESRGKCVLFVGRYRDAIDLADRCGKLKKGLAVFRGVETDEDGKAVPLSGDRRQAVVDAYMAHPGPCVAVAMGKSWGTGIDLQDTDFAAVVTLPWTPGELSQWIGRFRRLGMTRAVSIVLFVAEGTADERMQLSLMKKLPDIRNFSLDTDLIESSETMLGMDRIDEIIDEVARKVLLAAQDSSLEPPKEEE